MDCVILYRNTRNGRVGFVSDEDAEGIAVFPNEDAAIDAAAHVPILQAYPYQIVRLDEI